jgi:hypothetical protein
MPLPGKADIIFFKDGMKTVCQEKAWEEGQDVKCEYEGTILNYQKKDVLRIQKIRTQKKIEPPSDQIKVPAKPAAQAETGPAVTQSSVSKQKVTTKKDAKSVTVKPTGASKPAGLEFYNPRRPLKYWTSPSSKHQTFAEAIAALAKQYDRSPEWIQQQMGDTNDLDEIHRNLASGKTNAPVEAKAETAKAVSETLFYSPRRPHPYWSSATTKHKTFEQAMSALSVRYGRSEQWIQQYMGDSNNLNEIHQNLTNQKSSETSP